MNILLRAMVPAALLLAGSAIANSGGQIGFSGRTGGEGSCLACHGSTQFGGAAIAVDSGATTTCGQDDGTGTITDLTIPLITLGTTVPVTVSVSGIAAAPPACPTNDCCTAATAGDECLLKAPQTPAGTFQSCDPAAPTACCQVGFDTCLTPLAGFNIELEGPGEMSTTGNDDGDVHFVGENRAELTHSAPKAAADAVSWSMSYAAPTELPAEGNPVLHLGVNVSNGNGYADSLDLNGNTQLPFALTDGAGKFLLPGSCLVCGDNNRPAVNGSCCSCVSATPGRGILAAFGMIAGLAFLGLGRRRKRR